MYGLLGGLPPGLRGYVAAEQLGQQRTANTLGQVQGLLGLQNQQRQMAMQEQMAPLQLRLMQAQVSGAENPAPIMKDLGGSIGLFDPRTFKQIGSLPKTATPDAALKEAGADRRHVQPSGSSVLSAQTTMRGQDMSADTARRGQDITLRGQDLANSRALDQLAQGKVPPGYRAVPGGLEAIPGGPADYKLTEAGRKDELTRERGIKRADLVINKADEALGKVGFWNTGLIGDIRGTLPGRVTGSGAYDLEKTIDTIKANIGFQELADMRAASPTGGALGQIAVRELDFLQAAVAALDKGQSQDQLIKNLNAVKTHFANWKKAMENAGKQRRSTDRQYNGPDRRVPAVGEVRDGYKFKGGDPADPNSWEKQ